MKTITERLIKLKELTPYSVERCAVCEDEDVYNFNVLQNKEGDIVPVCNPCANLWKMQIKELEQ